ASPRARGGPVGGVSGRARRERRAIRRIDHRQRAAVARRHEAVGDEVPRRDLGRGPARFGSVHGIASNDRSTALRGARNKSLRPLIPSTHGPRSTLNALKAAEEPRPCAQKRILPDSGGLMMLTRTTQLAAAGALAAAAAFAAPAAPAHGGGSLDIAFAGGAAVRAH